MLWYILFSILGSIIFYLIIGALVYGYLERQFYFKHGTTFEGFVEKAVKENPEEWLDEYGEPEELDDELDARFCAKLWIVLGPLMVVLWVVSMFWAGLIWIKNRVVHWGMDSGQIKEGKRSQGGYR